MNDFQKEKDTQKTKRREPKGQRGPYNQRYQGRDPTLKVERARETRPPTLKVSRRGPPLSLPIFTCGKIQLVRLYPWSPLLLFLL